MEYKKKYFEEVVEKYGEVFVVLESGEEYQIHGERSYSLDYQLDTNTTTVRVEGLRGDEYLIVEFPLDAIEHHYTHAEV